MPTKSPSTFTLLLLISIANIAGLLFSPSLPALQQAFHIGTSQAQLTITIYLIGYALGQLPYGPIANHFGRKKAIYIGISGAILFSLLSWVATDDWPNFYFLLVTRFLTALGASVGLMITITIVAEAYEKEKSSKILSYLVSSFAIMPGLATTAGGFIVDYLGWQYTFLATSIYLTFVLILCLRLPETLQKPKPIRIQYIVHDYIQQFSNLSLVLCGLLMGATTSFFYVYASLAPFITINILHLSASQFGLANLLPQAGILLGSFLSGKIKRPAINKIFLGTGFLICGSFIIYISTFCGMLSWQNLFFPMLINLIGTTLIYSSSASLGTSHAEDKSNASSVMSFINMTFACFAVFFSGLMKTHPGQALSVTLVFLTCMMIFISWLVKNLKINATN